MSLLSFFYGYVFVLIVLSQDAHFLLVVVVTLFNNSKYDTFLSFESGSSMIHI